MRDFSTVKDTEGRYVAALPPAELEKLQARCERYISACAERGLTPETVKALLCTAVDYYRADSARGAVARAFARFSELRRLCIARGYVVPPIHGTPSASAIHGVCDLLAEGISAAEPLPGESADLTAQISAAYREAIEQALELINETMK